MDLARYAFEVLVIGPVDLVEEIADEQGDVLPPLAERRDIDLNAVEAVDEVLAEGAGADAGGQVAVRGGDDADV